MFLNAFRPAVNSSYRVTPCKFIKNKSNGVTPRYTCIEWGFYSQIRVPRVVPVLIVYLVNSMPVKVPFLPN